jgi:hypothetical protein
MDKKDLVVEWAKRWNVKPDAFLTAVDFGVCPPPFAFPSDEAMIEFEKILEAQSVKFS